MRMQTGLTGWLSVGRLGTFHSYGFRLPTTWAPTARMDAPDSSSLCMTTLA
jgi:hypothetical protein